MSQRDSGYERKERDLYETPAWATEALIPNLPRIPSTAWEPACGSGKMLRVLRAHIQNVSGTDIAATVPVDFLTCEFDGLRDAIITNPPYELATEFCERALRLMKPVHGLVAMLLRTDFDHAKSRAHLFADCPAFAKKLVLTKRITWFDPAPGEKGKSPSFNHAWFIWDWKHKGQPVIAYGPRDNAKVTAPTEAQSRRENEPNLLKLME